MSILAWCFLAVVAPPILGLWLVVMRDLWRVLKETSE